MNDMDDITPDALPTQFSKWTVHSAVSTTPPAEVFLGLGVGRTCIALATDGREWVVWNCWQDPQLLRWHAENGHYTRDRARAEEVFAQRIARRTAS